MKNDRQSEVVKKALSSSVRAISNDPNIEITFTPDNTQQSDSDLVQIPIPSREPKNNEIFELRGIGDSSALKIKYHDKDLHLKNLPKGDLAIEVYNAIEKVRYESIGSKKLSERAKLIRENKNFSNKIISIKEDEAEEREQSKSQEDVYNEESIYSKFTTNEDNKLMPKFHKSEWGEKLSILPKFKDERLKYFGKKLFYAEKPDLLTKEDYNLIHKDTAKKLLSTNDEKWNTIPRTYSEIDTLREKFEREGQPEKLIILDEINAYVEDLEKIYNSA